MIEEKRRSVRQKTFLRGFVRIDGNSSIDCFVRDISETGARLRFKSPPSIGGRLELNIPVKGQVMPSSVAWIDNCEVGIAFDTVAAVDRPPAVDGELAKRVSQLEIEIAALKQMLKYFQNYIDDKTEVA